MMRDDFDHHRGTPPSEKDVESIRAQISRRVPNTTSKPSLIRAIFAFSSRARRVASTVFERVARAAIKIVRLVVSARASPSRAPKRVKPKKIVEVKLNVGEVTTSQRSVR